MELDLPSLSRQIETLSKLPLEDIPEAVSPNAARQLRRNLYRLSVALESPGDIVDRIVYSVSTKARVSLRMFFLDANAWTGLAHRPGRHPHRC